MKKRAIKSLILFVLLFVIVGCSAASDQTTTGKPTPPLATSEAPKPTVIKKTTVSHADKIKDYQGPQNCLTCHPNALNDVMNSVHYQLKAPAPAIEGATGEIGMINRLCGLPGSIMPINWLGVLSEDKKVSGGCARCHIGDGTMITSAPTEAEKNGVDCLICHATKYDMSKRFPVKQADGSFKMPQDRSVEAAQSVGGPPTQDACLRCHQNNGGGAWYKRGLDFAPDKDVHSAANMSCVDCHKAEQHQFPHGSDSGEWARDLEKEINCAQCHTDKPHKDPAYNDHEEKIACQTCHIPTRGGAVVRDFIHSVQNPDTGLWDPKVEEMDKEFKTKPTYFWFNGKGNQEIQPLGAKGDGASKISPFKPLTTVLPRDAQSKKNLFMNLGVLAKTNSVDQAIAAGIKQYPQEYSGKWEPNTITGYFALSHNVTQVKALSCVDCHQKEYLDFKKLGYSELEIEKLKAVKVN